MNDFKFELNKEGVKELMQSAAMQDILLKHAKATQRNCGTLSEEYSIVTSIGKTRAKATVRPDTPHAHFSNLKHNTLLKALK